MTTLVNKFLNLPFLFALMLTLSLVSESRAMEYQAMIVNLNPSLVLAGRE